MPEITLDYEPQPRQLLLHETTARQIFYGGAAGGGKSHSLRWDAIAFCLANPGLEAFLFRRTLGELQDNHIRRIKLELPREAGKFSDSRNTFEFANGSVLRFCYCEREDDVRRYQGAEFHWLGIDEASHFTEFQIAYLRGRVRLGGFRPVEENLPRIVFGSNPGGPGHSFLKTTFIDGREPEVMFYDESMADDNDPDDKGWPSIFIPARIKDNKYLPSNYAGQFKSLPPELARALAEGDWDAVVGQALHTLSRDTHQLRPFNPPRHWTRFMSMDWGTASPFSIGWYCVSEGAILEAKDGTAEKWLPEGAVIRYREWYGWNGRSNKGCRMESPSVARGIIEREDGEYIDYRVADTEIWAQKDGICVAERMGNVDGRLSFRRAIKDRRRNYEEFLARLAGSPEYGRDGEIGEYPMFYITANCQHFWRSVPILTLDTTDPDKGPDTKLEDHVYDETAYALRSRPYVSTEEDRYLAEHAQEIKEARGKIVGRYAT